MRWGATLRVGVLWVVPVCLGQASLAARAEEESSADEAAPVPELVGDETSRTIAELAQRASLLEKRGDLPPEVQGPLSGVRLALEAMRAAWSTGNQLAVVRAEGLARAGLALAERRYSLTVEQGLMRAALARRDESRVRVQTARTAHDAESRRVRELGPLLAPALPAASDQAQP
jgi:hypothetical protein